jgi:DNA-binding transcriptional LysR family regulator
MKDAYDWEAVEFRHLRAFLAIVRQQSFSRAADELGYTQSAVSQQLLALERIVGASLFTRTPGGRRPVELTEAGRALEPHARALLARASAARADLDTVRSGHLGTIRVATIQSVGARILPDALARFRDTHPGITVAIEEATSLPQLADAVESAAVDIGFAALPTPAGPFTTCELLADPYVLVSPADSDLRSLSDLHGRRLLGIKGCDNELLVEQRLLGDGIVPRACERFDDNALIQALTAAGEGVAVVPQLTVDPADPRIAVHPVSELPPRRLTAITHSGRRLPPAAASFIDVARRVCAERDNPTPDGSSPAGNSPAATPAGS